MEQRAANNDKNILKVDDIHLAFGGLVALAGLTLEVKKHEILGIIGSNGSGKAALLNCITGFYRPQRGRAYFNGKDITFGTAEIPPVPVRYLNHFKGRFKKLLTRYHDTPHKCLGCTPFFMPLVSQSIDLRITFIPSNEILGNPQVTRS